MNDLIEHLKKIDPILLTDNEVNRERDVYREYKSYKQSKTAIAK